jgi:hypothetical protein
LAAPSATDPAANSINGHEYYNHNPLTDVPANDDLQYACIFPMEQPLDCTSVECDCSLDDVVRNKPLCHPPGGGPAGTTQYFAKAYPGLRQLEVLREFGENSIAASICPKLTQTGRELEPSFGYNPAMEAIIEVLKYKLNLQRCLPRELAPDTASGLVPCRVVEASFEDTCDCAARPGRKPLPVADGDERLADAMLDELRDSASCSEDSASPRSCARTCLCEIEQLNDAVCLEDPEPPAERAGYCYVDEAKQIGNPDFVSACPATARRVLRFIGEDTPRLGATTLIACAGASLR